MVWVQTEPEPEAPGVSSLCHLGRARLPWALWLGHRGRRDSAMAPKILVPQRSTVRWKGDKAGRWH